MGLFRIFQDAEQIILFSIQIVGCTVCLQRLCHGYIHTFDKAHRSLLDQSDVIDRTPTAGSSGHTHANGNFSIRNIQIVQFRGVPINVAIQFRVSLVCLAVDYCVEEDLCVLVPSGLALNITGVSL